MSYKRWRRLHRGILLRLLTILPVGLFCTAVQAEKFDDEPADPDFITLALTPQYQTLSRDAGHNGNYEFDFIGLQTLRQGGRRLGPTRVGWWWLYNDTYSGASTAERAHRAGLLWGFNDGDAPEGDGALGVLAVQQLLYDEQLLIEAGKLYPGNDFAESDYWGDDRDTFLSEMMAGDVAGRWFSNIGLGLRAAWLDKHWFLQGLLVDAQAENAYLDFDSLGKGRFLWGAEFGCQMNRQASHTRIGLLPYRIDETHSLSRETGWVLSATHEFGDSAEYALFGRYTWRHGGDTLSREEDESLPLRRGGFLGMAWNQPLRREGDRLALAIMQGSPSDSRRSQGFDDQYGLELYWKLNVTPWLRVTPDVQWIRNKDDKTETIVGLMVKLHANVNNEVLAR